MSQQMSLERMVAEWMADETAGGVPDPVLDQIEMTTSGMRPLPRWLAVVREPSMRIQSRVAVGMPARQLALIGALILLAAVAILGVGAALLLRPPQPTTDDWPGFRGDATRAGLAANGPVGNPVVRWQFHANGAIGDIAVAGDLALTPSDDGVLHALELAGGHERWTFTSKAPMHGPFVSNGLVFVADGDGVISALSLANGKPVWQSAERVDGSSDLTVADGRLYVGTSEGTVLGFDASSGALLWRTAVASAGGAIHAPSANHDVVAIATDNLDLAALDPATGALRWRVAVGTESIGTPVVVGDVVYIGGSADSAGGRLSAHDVATGAERWRIEENIYTPSIGGDVGYTGSAAGRVVAVDLATGTERWVTTFDGVVRAPAVGKDVIYVSADRERRIVALDRMTGGEMWSIGIDGANSCCIAAARGMVFVGTSIGTVYAIGGDGAKLTAKAPPSPTAVATSTASPSSSAASAAPVAPPLSTKLAWAATSGAPDFAPWGLAQAPDKRLWAVEATEDRFSIFTTDGTFVESWGSSGSGKGQFDLTRANGDPYGMIAFTSDGDFFLLDVGNRRVQHFSRDRKFVSAWGSFGAGPGQFSDPVSLALDKDGNVNVLDNARGVIETYSPGGKVLRTTPAFPAAIGPNDGANQLAVGPNGHFYVGVVSPNEVIELDPDGALVRTYGAPDSGQGAFYEQPNAIAFDAAGRMYVAQGLLRGDRPGILVFGTDGTYLGGFGPLGGGQSELGFPWGLVITTDGIYVGDPGGLHEFGYSSLVRKFEPITFP
jgi:outer membrane protein assembly factor BamB